MWKRHIAVTLKFRKTTYFQRSLMASSTAHMHSNSKCSVFVGNLPYQCDVGELAEFLGGSEYGINSSQIQLAMHKNGKAKGHGFVVSTSMKQTDTLLSLAGRKFKGRKLKIQIAKDIGTTWAESSPGIKRSSTIGPDTSEQCIPNITLRYPLVDIGANLTHRRFDGDLSHVLEKAKQFGIEKIMVTGTSLRHSKEALKLAKSYPGYLYCTAGVHPHDAKYWKADMQTELETLLKNPECVAVGECGLDFNRNFSPQDKQLEVFEKQVELACRVQKSLFVHEREAHTALVSVLSKYKDQLPFTVIHCFTGTKTEAQTYIDMGFYIGLTGYLWKEKSDNGVQVALKQNIIPVERLLLETDAPFMSPKIPKDGDFKKALTNSTDAIRTTEIIQDHIQRVRSSCKPGRNEPCSLVLVNDLIAICMEKDPEVVAMETTKNALKIFQLGM